VLSESAAFGRTPLLLCHSPATAVLAQAFLAASGVGCVRLDCAGGGSGAGASARGAGGADADADAHALSRLGAWSAAAVAKLNSLRRL
jgi:hypothetical protein